MYGDVTSWKTVRKKKIPSEKDSIQTNHWIERSHRSLDTSKWFLPRQPLSYLLSLRFLRCLPNPLRPNLFLLMQLFRIKSRLSIFLFLSRRHFFLFLCLRMFRSFKVQMLKEIQIQITPIFHYCQSLLQVSERVCLQGKQKTYVVAWHSQVFLSFVNPELFFIIPI